ncbi:MAG: SEC-C domain-containing protein [Patescibacteria group bacterium]|jgi:hypothetical protein
MDTGDQEREARMKRTDHFVENHQKFATYLERYPVVIPQEIVDREQELQQKADSATEFEEWKSALEEIRQHTGPYQRLYRLRLNPGSSKSEIGKLEEELSDCFCGSGKKFKECHGV